MTTPDRRVLVRGCFACSGGAAFAADPGHGLWMAGTGRAIGVSAVLVRGPVQVLCAGGRGWIVFGSEAMQDGTVALLAASGGTVARVA